jgi:hypothetical protein
MTLTQQEILDNPFLDNGDRASLITSLKSRQSEILDTQRAITDFQAGKMTVDPYSDDGKKLVDRVWSTIATKIEPERRLATVEEVVRQTGVVPDPLPMPFAMIWYRARSARSRTQPRSRRDFGPSTRPPWTAGPATRKF